MPQSYTPEFKKKIVRLHLEEGRTYKSITSGTVWFTDLMLQEVMPVTGYTPQTKDGYLAKWDGD